MIVFKGIIINYSITSALVAFIHYASIMLCFGSLVFERCNIIVDLKKSTIISLIISDSIYGIAGIGVLVSGILRVIKYGQGSEFYTSNPIFWIKVCIFICVGILSLYPTFNYIKWIINIMKGGQINISDNLIKRLKIILNFELIGLLSIPLFASLMARGINFS